MSPTAAVTPGTVSGGTPAPATPLAVTPTTPVDQVKTEDTKQPAQPHTVADGELTYMS
jgi:hypothetical protein